ncbi:helix-turn-helix domain-containing protein [Ruegeria arenilitoris]|uniref:helix-turn-helix domain-containing protein n=1 Tax=Ruegeria arenilitoris TaxID=1173585 RepID=UPI00147C6384|nr:helix-turn-helix domain-containing protein [Ruegeria arenilitoris]
MIDKTWITVREGAEILGVNPQTVRRLCKAGRIRSTRIGTLQIRIVREDVEKILETSAYAAE